MQQRTTTFFLIVALLIGIASIGFSAINSTGSHGASANAPDASRSDVGGQGSEKELLALGVHTGSGTSDWTCDNGQFTEWMTQLQVVGTMTGTNPVDTITLEQSIDHGTTVAGTINTLGVDNATATAGITLETHMTGIIANTPTTYGRCERVKWVAGGTGTVSANFGVKQYRH
jgi:hypothetical protein